MRSRVYEPDSTFSMRTLVSLINRLHHRTFCVLCSGKIDASISPTKQIGLLLDHPFPYQKDQYKSGNERQCDDLSFKSIDDNTVQHR